ncbi:cytochrome P450 [Sporichthya brevicatena]|uniref:Cytochrome P450 n=1 Tax=Sporichthya brevicatena TaxID=171442 RepID=A0ABP3RUE5_9ACTN
MSEKPSDHDFESAAERFLLADTDVIADPFPMFGRLREKSPVHYVESAGVWLVTRYEDICAVARNPQVFSSRSATGPHSHRRHAVLKELTEESADLKAAVEAAAFRDREPVLFRCDPPRHTAQRKIVNKAFSPSRVRQIEDTVQAICDSLLDDVLDKGSMDLVADLAVPLPITVIAGALGVSNHDLPTFKRWSDALAATIGNDNMTRDQIRRMVESGAEFAEFFTATIADRRAHPQDDLISDLVHARVDGDSLSQDELLTMLTQFLIAGNETTTTHITATVMLLLEQPHLMAQVQADLSLLPKLIEESLRVESPITGLYRTALVDTEIGGVAVPAGAHLLLCYSSGNRDPEQYADPETIKFDRSGEGAHLAFGQGPHFCLGSNLSKAESRIALEALLTRTKNLRLDPDGRTPERIPSYILRGVSRLDLLFDRA